MLEYNLVEEQIKLEEEMTSYGVSKYRKIFSEDFENSKVNSVLVHKILEDYINKIKATYEMYNNHQALNKGKVYKYFSMLPCLETMGYIAAKIIINNLYNHPTVTGLSYQIGTALETEVIFKKYKSEQKDYYKSILNNLKQRNASSRWQEIVVKKKFKDKGFNQELDWTNRDKIRVGLKLIELFISTTGLVKIKKGAGDKKFIVLTEGGNELIQKLNYKLELLCPFYMPMIVPPKDWTSGFDGGYISPYIKQNKFVKTQDMEYLRSLNYEDIPDIFNAVNTIQATKWKVNENILSVIKHFLDNSYNIDGFISFQSINFLDFPADLKDKPKDMLTEEDKERITQWKREVFFQHKEDIKIKSKRLLYYQIVFIADKFKGKEIYFPHHLDFRGRIYPIPVILNPQGNDLSRGLLTFGEGKPIENERNVDWLRIHGANCYGKDKESFKDRIKFIKSIEDEIKEYAENPLTNLGWTRTDKPFQFLAFCYEYSNFLKEGYAYVSTLAINLDGTCNGLQHYTAILRDENMAKAVNITPSEKPTDIYQVVADHLIDKLKHLEELNVEKSYLIEKWISLGINRKITKKSVMTLVYGASQLSCREYIQDYLIDNYSLEELYDHFKVGDSKEDCIYEVTKFLSTYLWEAIKEVLTAAIQVMGYIRNIVKLINKNKEFIGWTTPLNLRVTQSYKANKKVTLETEMLGKAFYAKVNEPTDAVDTRKQINSICPNFIHSLDACMLLSYINAAKAEGITNFACVHDSIGTDATNTELSSHLIRDAFVNLYQTEVLKYFTDDMKEYLTEKDLKKLPIYPTTGQLDIRDIWDSEYFFN